MSSRPNNFLSYLTEGIWIAFGQAMVAIGALVGVRILTEVLDPAAYGELALGTTLATLVNQTVFGPLGNGITRYYAPAREKSDVGNYVGSALTMVRWAVATMFVIAVTAVLALAFLGRTELIGIAVAFLMFATVSGCNGILNGIQNAARQRKIVAFFQGIDIWSRFLIAALMVCVVGRSSTVAAFGYLIASTFILCFQYLTFRKTQEVQVPAAGQDDWVSQIWNFSWPFATWGIFTWARLASDRWALQMFGSKEDVGFYAVVFQLGYYPMSLLTGMVTQLFGPILFQRAGNAEDPSRNAEAKKLSSGLVKLALALTGAGFLAALLLHRHIFYLLAAHEYAHVSYLLPWVILSGGIFAAAQIIGLDMMSRMQVRVLITCTIATALAGIALNFVGVYLFGLVGAIGAGLVFSVVYFAWILVLYSKSVSRQVAGSAVAAV